MNSHTSSEVIEREDGTTSKLRTLFYGADPTASAGLQRTFKKQIHDIKLNVDPENRRKFSWQIYWVAALGFLTDSYNLFAPNVVLSAISYLYWTSPDRNRESGFGIATLLGSIIGQIGFGIAVDWRGRKALYGLELLIVILSTVGLLQSSNGYMDTLNRATWDITGWLFFWRIVMGVGIGAEYPLSACIAAEWSPTSTRALTMGAVFLMQPLGQFGAYLLGYGFIHLYDNSFVNVDRFWRIIIASGTVPTFLAMLARFYLRETWRFTFFVVKKPKEARRQVEKIFTLPSGHVQNDEEAIELLDNAAGSSVANHEATSSAGDNANPHRAAGPVEHSSAGHIAQQPIEHEQDPGRYAANRTVPQSATALHGNGLVVRKPLSQDLRGTAAGSRSSIPLGATAAKQTAPIEWRKGEQFTYALVKDFLKAYGGRLLGVSACWFLLDVAYYGIGFNNPGTLARLWTAQDLNIPPTAPWWQLNCDVDPASVPDSAYIDVCIQNTTVHAIYTNSLAAIIGSILFIILTYFKLLNRRVMLIWTFHVLGGIFVLIAGVLKQFFHNGQHGRQALPNGHWGLVVLWALAQFVFNFGPNTLTFILPAEIFPTRYRCACYGISAAAGKLGAVVVQAIIWRVGDSDPNSVDSLTWLTSAFALCMFAGGAIAYFLPDTQVLNAQGRYDERSLEDLCDDGDLLK